MNENKPNRFLPLYIGLSVILGILVGTFYTNLFLGAKLNIIDASSEKINKVLHLIDEQYVDTVDVADLVEQSIPEILKKLDPHSAYIPAKDAEAATQDLRGSFSGIGVQFMIHKDTVRVVRVIPGGPSESAGLQSGDRIVSIDGETYVGENITNDEVMKRLKGPDRSKVKLGIRRVGASGLKTYEIIRGAVPVKSIDVVSMLDGQTGYIRVTNFGDTTYPEFISALATLERRGFRRLVLDLRGNPGGYMEPAVRLANELLPIGRLIVYMEGRKSPRQEFASDGTGAYQNLPLVVLIDESSASSSEILAGAIQDNDRGMIIGRRSFGKGLVQTPVDLEDGSVVRLTSARYYTPSGRCLQKPYTPGEESMYHQELLDRAEHGEYFSADSIKTSGEKYRTRLGRVVYGGGGIVPDIFVARDTVGQNSYFIEAGLGGHIADFSYDFVDRNRARLSGMSDVEELLDYLRRIDIVELFADYAAKNGLKRRNRMIQESHKLLEEYISGNIINDVMDVEAAMSFYNRTDPAVLEALELFHQNKAFPKAE